MADAEERRRLRQKAALAGLLLFSARKRLRPQIAMASHDVEDYFDAVDAALASKSISRSLKAGISIVPTMERLIRASYLGGFTDGGALAGVRPGSRTMDRIRDLSRQRAEEAAGMMLDTSRKWLKANPDNAFALSSSRAERAANYEADRAYFGGLHMVLSGRGYFKQWFTTSDNPCQDCLDNEDDDAIPMEEQFTSGDDAPPLHLQCACVLSVIQL